MANYALEIRYREGEPPIYIRLPNRTPDEAEAKRQAFAAEIMHAVEIEAPQVQANVVDPDLDSDVSIDPARVTEVNLVDDVEP